MDAQHYSETHTKPAQQVYMEDSGIRIHSAIQNVHKLNRFYETMKHKTGINK